MALPTEVTSTELRTLTGLPETTIRRWKSEAIIRPVKRGRWSTVGTLTAIIRHLRANHPGNERENLLREQTRWKRIQNDKLEQRLLLADEVEDGFVEIAGMFKAALLVFGARIAPEVTGVESQSQVREIVNVEVRRVLTDLSQRLLGIAKALRGDQAEQLERDLPARQDAATDRYRDGDY